jgi:RimJ/RimL family protein N-acetyltransferase
VEDRERRLLSWGPRRLPSPECLKGRYTTLKRLDAERDIAGLWRGLDGVDEAWDYLADGPYSSEAALRQALEEKQAGTSAFFLGILPNGADSAAGYASYMRMDPANGVIEVGNILLAPALQRTTAATEAMYLMARHVFEDLGYRRYEWKCNANNVPSRRAALRYGFSFEGIFRQHMIVKGENRDTAWYSMLDREWPERKAAFEEWLDPANFDENGRQRKALKSIGPRGQ